MSVPPRLTARQLFWLGLGLLILSVVLSQILISVTTNGELSNYGVTLLGTNSAILFTVQSTMYLLGIVLVGVSFAVRSLQKEDPQLAVEPSDDDVNSQITSEGD